MSADRPVVQLLGKELKATMPRSLTYRQELAKAAIQNEYLGWCATLGYCVPRIGQKVKPGFSLANVLEYGVRVSDYLQEQGETYADIRAAGRTVWTWVVKDLPDWSRVKEAEDFTDPKEAAPTEPS
jgi:hypothetical protein